MHLFTHLEVTQSHIRFSSIFWFVLCKVELVFSEKPQKLCIRPSFEYFLEISIVRLLNKNWIQFFLEGKFHNICIFEDAFVIRKDCAGQMHRRVQSAEIKIRVAIQGTKLCVLKCSISFILHGDRINAVRWAGKKIFIEISCCLFVYGTMKRTLQLELVQRFWFQPWHINLFKVILIRCRNGSKV